MEGPFSGDLVQFWIEHELKREFFVGKKVIRPRGQRKRGYFGNFSETLLVNPGPKKAKRKLISDSPKQTTIKALND